MGNPKSERKKRPYRLCASAQRRSDAARSPYSSRNVRPTLCESRERWGAETPCGADFDDPMLAFAAHRQRIEQLIITLIRQGRCEDDEMMVIRVRDLLRGGGIGE